MLICQLTDLHLRPKGRAAYGVVDTNGLTERAFQAVAALAPRPDIVVITGDLTECGLEPEYAVLPILARCLAMPIFVIPGNHDQRAPLRHVLRDFPGVRSDPDFVQYTVEDYPVRLVMLDTLVPGEPHGELCPDRLAFLDRALAAEPDRPTMIAMHHPPFTCGIDHMDHINLRNAAAFTQVVANHRQVQRIICGHHHRPVVGQIAQAIALIAPSVAHQVELELRPNAPGAFVMEPPGFYLHRWRLDTGIVSHTAYVEGFPGPFPFTSDPTGGCP